MIDLSTIQPTFTPEPMKIVLYGPLKIGKTTVASQAPGAIFLPVERGLSGIKAAALPTLENFNDWLMIGRALKQQEHNFKTLVIDSLDWLERLIWRQVCNEHHVNSIADIDFGKGYTAALEKWASPFLAGCDELHSAGMTIVLICHSDINRYENPETDAYDRMTLKLHKKASGIICEWADAVLFANYKVMTTSEKMGFGNERTRAVGTSERVLYTQEKPAFIAGNRYGWAPELPMHWNAIQSAYDAFIARLGGATNEGETKNGTD